MRRLSAFDGVVMGLGLILLLVAAPGAGPALAAARAADGTPGTFTAARLSCVLHPGHEQCTWSGDFVSDAGAVRRGVDFYGSDREMFAKGQRARAFDTGRPDRVYGPGGSNEWIVVALVGAAGAALVLWPLLGRRRARAPAY